MMYKQIQSIPFIIISHNRSRILILIQNLIITKEIRAQEDWGLSNSLIIKHCWKEYWQWSQACSLGETC